MSLGGVIGLMEIPVAMMFGYFLFNEHISIVTGLGAILIVIKHLSKILVNCLEKKVDDKES